VNEVYGGNWSARSLGGRCGLGAPALPGPENPERAETNGLSPLVPRPERLDNAEASDCLTVLSSAAYA
jgi:hypothetical protein